MAQPLISVTQFALEVVSANPPAGASLSLSGTPPAGQVGTAYTFPFVASGGTPPYTFSICVASLPPGLVIDPLTGIVSGTPTTVGTFCFTVCLVDSVAGSTSLAVCITIYAAVVITLLGWKLYPDTPCETAVPGLEVPHVKRAV